MLFAFFIIISCFFSKPKASSFPLSVDEYIDLPFLCQWVLGKYVNLKEKLVNNFGSILFLWDSKNILSGIVKNCFIIFGITNAKGVVDSHFIIIR